MSLLDNIDFEKKKSDEVTEDPPIVQKQKSKGSRGTDKKKK